MYIIEVLKSILFGIVEGITEWLPISSTGHMILLEKILPFKDVSDGFFDMYLVVIQLGAIIAVVIMFWNKLWPFRRDISTSGQNKILIRKNVMILWFKVIVGSIPAGVIGLFLNDILDEYLYNHITVSITLIIYGVAFLVVEHFNKRRPPRIKTLNSLTYKDAFCIGLFQALSLIPGTSRSGSTILGGILIGTSRRVASEFTFFLAVPAMVGASLLKIIKFGGSFTSTEMVILLDGMITAFAVSIVAIRFLMNYIKKHNFNIFGFYRIILGGIVLITYLITK